MTFFLTLSTVATLAATLPPGGGSPSMHTDQQRVTGTILTVWSKLPHQLFRIESGGLNSRWGSAPLELIVPVPRWERRDPCEIVTVDAITHLNRNISPRHLP